MKKVFIVGGNSQYRSMFIKEGWEIAPALAEADLVQFCGGADVNPALYGQQNTRSNVSLDSDFRDLYCFRLALAYDIPMAGICRGGQFLNVMAGGEMIQHVDGHATGRMHEAIAPRKGANPVMVTSTHHQMMIPSVLGRVLLKANIVGDDDTEAVYYQHINALCFQPHPEFDGAEECRHTYFTAINEYLFHNRSV